MRQTVWNVILTALATALLGLLGWTLIHLNRLEQAEARRAATEFKIQDAAELQRELTKIVTDIDIRIRLMERDMQWIKFGPSQPKSAGGLDQDIPDPTPDPPRYQLEAVKKN